MQNPVQVQILQTLQRHQNVRLDVGRCDRNTRVSYDDLQIGLHELEHQRHLRFRTEHIEQSNDVLVMQLLKQFDLS